MMKDGYDKELIKGELVKFKKWPKKLGKWGKILKVILYRIRFNEWPLKVYTALGT